MLIAGICILLKDEKRENNEVYGYFVLLTGESRRQKENTFRDS